MAPTPQLAELVQEAPKMRPPPGEEVVISGMSGIFPKSNSVQQFMENLYNKVDMVTSDDPRWVFDHPEVPKHLGKVDGMGKFDAQFFRVNYKQACTMEPMSRKLLEHAYTAIYDAGMNPLQLRGSKLGVFIGSTFSESERTAIYGNVQRNGFGITGCNKAMYANRISYWLDSKGPSYALDTACTSSMTCLEQAYRNISSGLCDAAIVGGCNLCMHPNVSLNFRRAGFLCMDGKTRCFDKNSDGYVRSDAICAIFLQKAKNAKRIYAEVYHAKESYSPSSDNFLSIREPKELQQFLKTFYSEINVSPSEVEFVEANGAAIPEADKNELEAIANVFEREKSVKIGCVKSNMGFSEPASGICSLIKACIAFHKGIVPGNLHYEEPLDIPEIKDGKIEVLTDNADFNRRFIALNTLSYSGVNNHVLLKGRYKAKDLQKYKTSIPYLVLISGRQNECVESIFNKLKNSPVDPEQIGLLHNIHMYDTLGHMSRGYTILKTNEENQTICLSQSVQHHPGNRRPIWFVYSGMGSQWAGMGAELMRIPIFVAAIEKCHKVLEPKGIDIIKILTDPDKTIYDNILHSFVGIAAVQIGLTDILKELGIVPDHIIGHSVGELGCAYADGCFTAEEMILSAYSRGLVSIQTPLIKGSMAAVGLGYKKILPLCPPEIEVACHNSSESATISGPAHIMKQFVSELTSQGIFAKEVPCSNIAYHSRYIADAGPNLLKYLSDVIKNPKQRSEKWVSTSVPQNRWDEPVAKYSSAEYHTNNLLNSVLFEEASKLIQNDALVIEIAPHGLLQAILKRSLSNCVHVPLTRRGTSDPIKFLLEAVGKLYESGLNPKIEVLYPKIQYPVSTGTPFLSNFVEWQHSEDWPEATYNNKDRMIANIRNFVMSIHDDDYKYFKGHARDGQIVFPESAFLYIAWETLAMYKGFDLNQMSVVFRDVHFHGEVIIKPESPLRLQIMIHRGNKFEVTYEKSTIVSGFIYDIESFKIVKRLEEDENNTDAVILSSDDIYKIMDLKGHCYKDEFKTMKSVNSTLNKAYIKWTNNWILLLDSLIQFNNLARNHDGISVPNIIKSLTIDLDKHNSTEKFVNNDVSCIKADLYKIYDYIKCGGVELAGIIFEDIPESNKMPDILLAKEFIPHILVTEIVDMNKSLEVNLQIVSENVDKKEIKVAENIKQNKNIIEALIKTGSKIPSVEFVVEELNEENADLIVVEDFLENENKMKEWHKLLPNNTFILALENEIKPHKNDLYNVITAMNVQNKILVLLRSYGNEDRNIIYMPVTQDFSWVNRLYAELAKSKTVMLVSEGQTVCGLIEIVKKLRQKYQNKIGLIMIGDNSHIPKFNPENSVYKDQLSKNLSFNIYKNGHWGGYYYISKTNAALTSNVILKSSVPGDLDSLVWVEQPNKSEKIKVKVCYAGPSFKDAENAALKTSNQTEFGMDFSGVDERGQRVMGLIESGAIASTVAADLDLLWPVPDHWTLEDAATVPLPYIYAYYCLTIRLALLKNKIVFVNGGDGAIGQAVISICLSLDCKVYVTVSDAKKKEFLLRVFPELNEKSIGFYQEEFFDNITKHTNRLMNGCHLLINFLSGYKREAAMSYTQWNGCFLDLNEDDMRANKNFGMNFLQKSGDYMTARISHIFRPEYSAEKKLLQVILSEGISRGTVRPLSRVVYSQTNVFCAFRFLANKKHNGRALIMMANKESLVPDFNAISRISYPTNGAYVIVCGDTVLGLELVDHIVSRGARKLLINVKPNSFPGYCYTKLLSWNKQNVTINICTENIQTENDCLNLLKKGSQLGPILGIFIVQNLNSGCCDEETIDKHITTKFNMDYVVANMDLTSRSMCKELEHFVLLNYSRDLKTDEYVLSVSEKVCEERHAENLPALVFHIDSIKEFDDIKDMETKIQPQPLNTVLNALETSMKLKLNNVTSFNMKTNAVAQFLTKIAKIIGVQNINDLDESLNLYKLTLSKTATYEIKESIKEAYQISYIIEKVQQMTIADLKNLKSSVLSSTNINKADGLGTFFSCIIEDECLAAEPIIPMATLFSNIKEENELDPKATYLMMVPGFEGHHEIFTCVCERLKVQAMAIQYGPDLTDADIPEYATHIMKFIKNRVDIKSKFYLLGYSFGVNVALELASLFEKEGHEGVVYCLDSSPDALKIQLDAYIGNLSESELENEIIQHMYKLMSKEDNQELYAELRNKETWQEKTELCVYKLKGLAKYSHQYKRSLLQGAYKRIMIAKKYEPTFKLKSQLVLIKGTAHPLLNKLPEDYGLSKYTTQTVQVFEIAADHAAAPQDIEVTNIVNRLLEAKLLEAFKKKNLCWSYVADPIKNW